MQQLGERCLRKTGWYDVRVVQFVSSNADCVLPWYIREKTIDVEGAHVSTLWHAAIADGVVKLKAVLYHELAELGRHRLK